MNIKAKTETVFAFFLLCITLHVAEKTIKTARYNQFYPFYNKNDCDFIEDFSFVHQPNKT